PGMPPTAQTEVTIEAFVRAFGTFSAWNLISLFMELYVGLTTVSHSGVTGTARFSVSTRVGWASYSYSASHQERLVKASSRGQSRASGDTSATRARSFAEESVIHTDVPLVEERELLELLSKYEG